MAYGIGTVSCFGGAQMQFTVTIPDEYREKIAEVAKNTGLKRSDIVRLALKKFFEESIENDKAIPYEKVRHLIGSAESGIGDLGQRHREHLIKRFRGDF
jgi:predicted DNA-binding protein